MGKEKHYKSVLPNDMTYNLPCQDSKSIQTISVATSPPITKQFKGLKLYPGKETRFFKILTQAGRATSAKGNTTLKFRKPFRK